MIEKGWGIQPWGTSCWGSACSETVEFFDVNPPCETTNNPRDSVIDVAVKASDPAEQIDLDTVVIYVEVDGIDLPSESVEDAETSAEESAAYYEETSRRAEEAVSDYREGYKKALVGFKSYPLRWASEYRGPITGFKYYPFGYPDRREGRYADSTTEGWGTGRAGEIKLAEEEGWQFPTLVYMNSSFNSPWTGIVTPYLNGFRFRINPPGTFPRGIRVKITFYAETESGLQNSLECFWKVEEVFSINIEIISLTKLLVRFSDKLNYKDNGASIVNNWEVVPVGSGFIEDEKTIVNVITAVPDGSTRNPQHVVLNTTQMIPNQRYKVIIRNLKDIYGKIVNASVLFIMRKTKVDNQLTGLPSVWETGHVSNFFWVMSAIGKSDEKISATMRDVDI